MIIGIGNDIVDIRRIKKIIERFGDRFINRCFSEQEIKYASKKNKEDSISVYAKRFSAKEAVSKAIGTGISGGITFKDILIENNKAGKPEAIIRGRANEIIIGKIPKDTTYNVHISISDEFPYAQSFAIIEVSILQ